MESRDSGLAPGRQAQTRAALVCVARAQCRAHIAAGDLKQLARMRMCGPINTIGIYGLYGKPIGTSIALTVGNLGSTGGGSSSFVTSS